MAVPLAPLAEQKEIVRRVEAMFKLADGAEERVAAATLRAEKLSQAILAKAFRGELVPTEAEIAAAKDAPTNPPPNFYLASDPKENQSRNRRKNP